MEEFDLVITTNSPGELMGWVKPTVEQLNRRVPEARIILCITPCNYASGRELEVARTFPGIFEIVIPSEYQRWVVKGIPPQGLRFKEKGVVVFLGGDLFHAVLIARKLAYPALAYTENRIMWKQVFKKFLLPDEETFQRFARLPASPASRQGGRGEPASQRGEPDLKDKLTVVGNLAIEKVAPRLEKGIAYRELGFLPEQPLVTFMPGSRPVQSRHLVPFFLGVADLIRARIPDAQFAFALSPFITGSQVEGFLQDFEIKKGRWGTGGVLGENNQAIRTEGKTEIRVFEDNQYDLMNISTLIVTPPGTVTAEAAALGVPMLVVVPFNHPEAFPLDGLAGIVGDLPIIGFPLKWTAIRILNQFIRFTAQPNIKAGRKVVPELRGMLEPEQVASYASTLLKDKEAQKVMRRSLKSVMGPPGASEKIVAEILKVVES